MSFWNKLFGGGAAAQAPSPDPIDYKGFRITPQPIAEDGQFRVPQILGEEP